MVNKKLLAKCIAVPLLVGGLSSFLTRSGMKRFMTLNQPPLSPPGWLFGVAWTVLYTLMGISFYLIIQSKADEAKINKVLAIYVYQLVVNFLWPTFFFNFGWYLFAFAWLVLLWILVFVMILRFYRVSKPAGLLQIPYLLWLTFAGYLNLGIWLLN